MGKDDRMSATRIAERLGRLPDGVRGRVLEDIDGVLRKYESRETGSKELSFDWEGGLEELRDRYTSVQLQHKALEWR